MLHGWSSADAQWFIHGRAPFSSCFSPSVSFLRANGAVWGLSLGGWGGWREPRPQRVAAINGAGVRKQPASYPGNPRCVRGTDGGLDAAHGNSDKSWEDLVRAAQHHVAMGHPQQLLKLGWPQGLGGCQGSRGSIAGCSKEGQPHGGCSAHFHVFSAFFPSQFLSALAGSCAGAHLRCPQPLGSPTRCQIPKDLSSGDCRVAGEAPLPERPQQHPAIVPPRVPHPQRWLAAAPKGGSKASLT